MLFRSAKIADPEPTRFIGPRKNPNGVNIANTIAKTNGDCGKIGRASCRERV